MNTRIGYFLTVLALCTPSLMAQGSYVEPIFYGNIVEGALDSQDEETANGSYKDRYEFSGTRGDQIVVELTSTQFDTYVVLFGPQGMLIENDDYLTLKSQSRLEFMLPEDGLYQIVVTSYSAYEVGAYSLTLLESATPRSSEQESKLFGIFIGIGEYNGNVPNLQYTAEDAIAARNVLIEAAGMKAENSIVLTDRDAIARNVQMAFRQMRETVGPDDTFIFYFSGHGDRVKRSDFEAADPDYLDETLILYDSEILDNELDILLGQINARAQLVLLDACYSGGFAKDVISKPNRMGLFSSEEDLTSSVADQFRAGGYLSLFFSDAIRLGHGDLNGDRKISSLELSEYLAERYLLELRGPMTALSNPQVGYQKLVVDRGGVSPHMALFNRR